MLINDLPDDCLITIFSYVHDLDHLLNCYKVCFRWNQLILHRLSKVKCLSVPQNRENSLDTVHLHKLDAFEQHNLDKMLLNLKYLDLRFNFDSKNEYEHVVRFVENLGSHVKGYINVAEFNQVPYEETVISHLSNLEMFSSNLLEEHLAWLGIGAKVKQLFCIYYFLTNLEHSVMTFPNLKRLHFSNIYGTYDKFWPIEERPILEKVEIVEFGSLRCDISEKYHGFHLTDFCPSLKSAYHTFDADRQIIDGSIKNLNMRDLVIDHMFNGRQRWISLKVLLMKYPRLKHLAIRNNHKMKDNHIEELIQILPNLVLLDVRGSPGVTQNSADYMKLYCKRTNRSIEFYYESGDTEKERDWPKISVIGNDICKGFDFMRNCFFKPFYALPHFLDTD